MAKYRIRIEKLDFEHNILYQSQVEINDEMIKNMRDIHGLDAINLSFNQLKQDFFKHIEKNEKENEQGRNCSA
jgi:predicted adenine nucleotide alpha hydrolase (AANH) superfamily ATPase